MRTYSELIKITDFRDRIKYLETPATVGAETFAYERYLNQTFYRSKLWRRVRDQILVRDSKDGRVLDLAHPDYPIFDGELVVVHHLNPLTISDLEHSTDNLLDPEGLVAVRDKTHRIIHYGGVKSMPAPWVPRSPYDTCPWR